MVDIELDQESQDQLQKSAYAQAMTGAIVRLGKAVELALNLRDKPVILEMETVCSSMFTQAKAILDNKDNLQ